MRCGAHRTSVLRSRALILTLTLTLTLTKACCAPGPTGFVAKTLLMNIAMPAAAACALKRDGGSEAGEQAAMRSYRRAALLAGFVSVCEEESGDSRASLPSTLRAEAETFAAAVAARSTGASAGTHVVSRDSTWEGLLGGYEALQLEATPIPILTPNLNPRPQP